MLTKDKRKKILDARVIMDASDRFEEANSLAAGQKCRSMAQSRVIVKLKIFAAEDFCTQRVQSSQEARRIMRTISG
jgi:hypothetical protein